MLINKEDFITEMARRNGVTKKATREFTDLFLKTFFELLTEGHTIRFYKIFKACMLPSAVSNKSVNNINAKTKEKKQPYRRFSIKLSYRLKKKINDIMNEKEGSNFDGKSNKL